MTETNRYQSPYSPTTDADQRAMLDAVGVKSVDDLFSDIPARFYAPKLNLPPPMSELELQREIGALAARNMSAAVHPCFLGAGAYNHYTPSVIGAMVSRGEFLTSYTPYQPEVSQGTLQVAYEFQSMAAELLGMDVANAGMYDGASSLAEASLMACRLTSRTRVLVAPRLNPSYRDVLGTYTRSQGIRVEDLPASGDLPSDTACALVQSPDFFGYIQDVKGIGDRAHAAGALLVVSTDPTACALFQPPGALGADIATAEGQALGIPLQFGGPYVGLFTCQQRFVRQMPGRIVGRTVDTQGRTAYVLTLQTREQHIRRERATSNICTSEQLLAMVAAVYVALLGKRGMRKVAELCYQKAHYAASQVARLCGYEVPAFSTGTFFQEFVARCPVAPSKLNDALLEEGIIGGLDVSGQVRSFMQSGLTPVGDSVHEAPQERNGLLLCVTEVPTRQDIDRLVKVLAKFQG